MAGTIDSSRELTAPGWNCRFAHIPGAVSSTTLSRTAFHHENAKARKVERTADGQEKALFRDFVLSSFRGKESCMTSCIASRCNFMGCDHWPSAHSVVELAPGYSGMVFPNCKKRQRADLAVRSAPRIVRGYLSRSGILPLQACANATRQDAASTFRTQRGKMPRLLITPSSVQSLCAVVRVGRASGFP
jgi:hypothetical protein